MLIACTHTFADSPAGLSQCCVFVLDTDRWGRAVKPRFLFSFVGINIYSFASLSAHPQQLASVIIQITTFSVSASSYPVIFFFLPFTSFQVNRKDPISWSNWIHYHFNNPEQWESYSHCYEPDIKNEIRRMGGWHRRAAKRALMREVTRGLSEVWKPEQRVRNGEGEN